MPYALGSKHGSSIKNPETYNSLMRKGMDQGKAAAISNAAVRKGHRKGRHRKHKGR
jgi:uncharacterized protein YoaH (UPF0181 family)